MFKTGICIVLLLFPAACSGADPVRPPAFAGSFYPEEPGALRAMIKKYVSMTPDSGTMKPVALIAPHAGYPYSGRCAASVYKTLKGKTYKRVIVIGPSHRGMFRGIALPDYKQFKTPFGKVSVDTQAVQTLLNRDIFCLQPQYERAEHSVEVHVPFLQHVLPDFKFLPLIVGSLNNSGYREASNALLPFAGEDTLIVASSDFTHFGRRFRFTPFKNDILQKIQALDFDAVKCILDRDRPGFTRYINQTGATVCGHRPIALLLALFKKKYRASDPEAAFISYTTSAAVTGGTSDRHMLQTGSVSYAGIVFSKPGTGKGIRKGSPMDLLPPDAKIDREAARKFLSLARTTLEKRLSGKGSKDLSSYVDFDTLPEEGKYKAGAFVTLKKSGALRGCIGTIQPLEALWEAITGNAINAALNDWRFSAVTKEELKEIDIEISVLTPPREVSRAEEFKVGTHGIIIEKEGKRAVFLPQVAPEQGWDRNTTLSHLCRKAGLPSDAWEEGTRFWVFEAQVFGEKEQEGT